MKKLLSIKDACRFLSIGRTTLYALLKEEKIKARKLGKRTLIPHEEIISFINDLPQQQQKTGDAK